LTQKEGTRDGVKNSPTELRCPFTGVTTTLPPSGKDKNGSIPSFVELFQNGDNDEEDDEPPVKPNTSGCPFSGRPTKMDEKKKVPSKSQSGNHQTTSSSDSTTASETSTASSATSKKNIGVSAAVTKKLFPYHIIVDSDFTIQQVGDDLPSVLCDTDTNLVGNNIADIFVMTKPIGMDWNWDWIRKLGDQSFDLKPISHTQGMSKLIRFKSTVKCISDVPPLTMLILTPAANNLEDLREMNLTLSDLPVHGAHRDAVFLREHLSTHMSNALKMEKLSKSLEREKQLLESLLPEHAANGLRAGKTVEPMLHNNVT
jgi:hypothetical protein